jgi:hypothetical protein
LREAALAVNSESILAIRDGGDADLGWLAHDGAALGDLEAAGEAEIFGRVPAVGKDMIVAQNTFVNERDLVSLLADAAEALGRFQRGAAGRR